MNDYQNRNKEISRKAVVSNSSLDSKSKNIGLNLIDNRTDAIAQRKLIELSNSKLEASKGSIQKIDTASKGETPIQKMGNNRGLPEDLKSDIENFSGFSMNEVTVHSNPDNPSELEARAIDQGADVHFDTDQEKHLPHEAWHAAQQKSGKVKPTMQMRSIVNVKDKDSSQLNQTIQKKENNTGLPDNLKSGIENLSGLSMDDVNVHRNSDKPAGLQAHAYAQGTDIHLGPGQEKHLPHEAWHVVQQKQGRVKPTMQMKGKVNVNDDVGLEKEADIMGGKAIDFSESSLQLKEYTHKPNSNQGVIQAVGRANMQVVRFFKMGGKQLTRNNFQKVLSSNIDNLIREFQLLGKRAQIVVKPLVSAAKTELPIPYDLVSGTYGQLAEIIESYPEGDSGFFRTAQQTTSGSKLGMLDKIPGKYTPMAIVMKDLSRFLLPHNFQMFRLNQMERLPAESSFFMEQLLVQEFMDRYLGEEQRLLFEFQSNLALQFGEIQDIKWVGYTPRYLAAKALGVDNLDFADPIHRISFANAAKNSLNPKPFEEAVRNVQSAISHAISCMIAINEELPEPSPLLLDIILKAKGLPFVEIKEPDPSAVKNYPIMIAEIDQLQEEANDKND